MNAECPELVRFVRGELDAAAFPHQEHVRMAFEMLRRHDFAESVWLFSRALRAMAAQVGKPEAFHQTVTIGFLSIIAERMEGRACADFAEFAHQHSDLLDKKVLTRWYRAERLGSPVARRTFVLPDSPPCE